MKTFLPAIALVMMIALTGCTAAVVAGGATGGYAVATDERSVDRMVDDSTITSRINTDMMNDSGVKARQIDVDTVGGNVTLTGVVGTREEADRALAIAGRAPGVKSVKDNLQIGEKSWAEFFNDKVLGSKIKSKLIVEPEIRSLNIDVDVHRGIVTLTGMVDSGRIAQLRLLALLKERLGWWIILKCTNNPLE
jgi:osmotically-inducible protein OsmY